MPSAQHPPTPPQSDVASLPVPDDGTAPLTDAQLRALLVRAREGDDAVLRQLVTDHVTLRRVTADILAFLEAREGGAAVAGVPLLLRARRLVGVARR